MIECKHGQLKRQCNICELEEENNSLKLQVNIYMQALKKAVNLPKGQLPDDKHYYTYTKNGKYFVERIKND